MSRTNNKQEYMCELSNTSYDVSRGLIDWAGIFNSFFNKSNVMVRTDASGITYGIDDTSVNNVSTALVTEDNADMYIWHVRFPYMELDDIVHFKLQHYDSSNTAVNAPLRLYMAYTPLDDGAELDWVPVAVIPSASTIGSSGANGWAYSSSTGASNSQTSLHVLESIRGDIFVQVVVKWINPSTYEIDSTTPGIKMAPLFALLKASHRSPSDSTTRVKSVIYAGFSQAKLETNENASKFALPSTGYMGAGTLYTGSGLTGSPTLGVGMMMSPSLYFAPDVDTSKTYGVMFPHDMVQTSVDGLKQANTPLAAVDTSSSLHNVYRQPLTPGPIKSYFTNSSISSPIRSQLMVPVMSPFSYYVADSAGLLFYSETWKQGIGTFNGHQYIFIDNFALLND